MIDLTTCKIKRGILSFAIPIMCSLLMQQLYNVADTIIVGKFLGVDELSAVGNAGTIIGIFLVISGGFEMGCEVLFAKYMGEKSYHKLKQGVLSVWAMAAVMAVGLSVLCLGMQEYLFAWMRIPAELWSMTSDYLSIYMGGLICVFLYDISRAILTACGDSKTPLYIMVATSVGNIIMDIVFVVYLGMGVKGAAIATVLAQFAGMALVMVLVVRKIRGYGEASGKAGISLPQMGGILSVAFPSMVQQWILSCSMLILQTLVNPFGSEYISAYIAAHKIISLCMMATAGLYMTVSIFTSQNVGAGETGRIKEGFRFSRYVNICYMGVLIAVILAAAPLLVSLFINGNEHPQAITFGAHYLRFSCIMMAISVFKNINESLIRGYAKMKQFLASNLTDLFIRVLFSVLLVALIGLDGLWMAAAMGNLAALGVSTVFVKRIMPAKFR